MTQINLVDGYILTDEHPAAPEILQREPYLSGKFPVVVDQASRPFGPADRLPGRLVTASQFVSAWVAVTPNFSGDGEFVWRFRAGPEFSCNRHRG
jgi:hypothetical protein